MSSKDYFENLSARTPEDIKELYRSYFFGRASAIIFHGIVALYLAVSAALFIYYLWALWVFNIPMLAFFAMAALLLLYRLLAYKKYVRLAERALVSDESTELVVIVDGGWLFTDESRERGIPLSSVRRAYLTDHLIYLTFGQGGIIILSRQGFSTGSEAEFLDYLKERKISVSGK